MSAKFDAKAYKDSWNQRLIWIMAIAIIAMTGGAIVLNIAAAPDCVRNQYVYCPSDAAPHH